MIKVYNIETVRACSLYPVVEHVKTQTLVRVGYANDKYVVSCSCGGEFIALSYAKKVRS